MGINKIRIQKGLSKAELMERHGAEETEVFYYTNEQGVKNDEAIHAPILEGGKLSKKSLEYSRKRMLDLGISEENYKTCISEEDYKTLYGLPKPAGSADTSS